MKARWIVLPVVGGLAAMTLFGAWLDATGYVAPTDPPPAHVISGTFTLVDDATAKNGCVGPDDGNWKDVHPGAEVDVSDGDGQQVGSGSLGDGQATIWGQYGEAACAYPFTVGVPDAASYTIDYPGGLSLDYTLEDMKTSGWAVGSACCNIVPGN